MDYTKEERLKVLCEEYSLNNDCNFNIVSLSSNKNYEWNCKKCSNVWRATFYNRYKNKSNCPKCAVENVSFKRQVKSINKHGSLVSHIPKVNDYWSSFNYFGPHEISINSKKVIIFVCSKRHYWSDNAYKISRGGFKKCPYCNNRKLLPYFNDCTMDSPDIIKYWDYSKNMDLPHHYFSGSGVKKFFICGNGHSKFSTIRNRIRDNFSCKECSFIESSLEAIVSRYLTEDLNLTIIRNRKPIKWGEKRLEIDIQIPDLKIAFEIQDYWTHNKFLNNKVVKISGREKVKKGPEYHENKRILARKQLNLKLFDIWEDDIRSGEYINIINNILSNL